MDNKYIGMERFIFADCYKLFLNYKDMDDHEVWWEAFIKEENRLAEKYDNCELVRDLLYGVEKHIEFKVRQRGKYYRMNESLMNKLKSNNYQ